MLYVPSGAAEKVTNPEVEKVEEEEKQAAAAEDEKEAEELKEGAEEGAEEGTAEEEGDEDDAGDDTAEEAMDEDLENTSQVCIFSQPRSSPEPLLCARVVENPVCRLQSNHK